MKITEIEVEVGISFEHKKVWYKNSMFMRATLDENDNEEECKKQLWDKCIMEVENQVDEIKNI